MWGGRILVICVLVFTAGGCAWTEDAHCPGHKPREPDVIRTPDFFGVVKAEKMPMYGATIAPRGNALKVGDRALRVDDDTEFLSGDCPQFEACGVFVGLRADGKTIDWALTARSPGSRAAPYVVNGGPWRVDDDAVVLSEGVRLALPPTFRVRSCGRGANNNPDDLEDARFGAAFYISAKGEVVEATCVGCA
jgi:hypothetical protein